jgi:hypothetical protein
LTLYQFLGPAVSLNGALFINLNPSAFTVVFKALSYEVESQTSHIIGGKSTHEISMDGIVKMPSLSQGF